MQDNCIGNAAKCSSDEAPYNSEKIPSRGIRIPCSDTETKTAQNFRRINSRIRITLSRLR